MINRKQVFRKPASSSVQGTVKSWITRFSALLLPAGVAMGNDVPSKPNVVVILADDLGYQDLGVQGCPDVPTPNIDSLAANGIRCTDAYVTAPVCSPSRAGLLTGRYQNRFGFEFLVNTGSPVMPGKTMGLHVGEKTIADRMKEQGYVTGCIGKWHVGDEPEFYPQNRGFDEFYGTLGQGNYYTPVLMDSRKDDKGHKLEKRDGYYLTDDYNARAVEFINRYKSQPFFLYLPHYAVHKPFEATEKYLSRFDKKTFEDPRRYAYAGMLSAMDDGVGQVLAALRTNGLEENTLIFFLSDNGGTSGVGCNLPLNGKKGATWEGGIRTPFLVQWKGRLPGGTLYDGLISSMDIFPTAVAAAGGTVSEKWNLDGVNLLPYLTGGKEGSPHDVLFWRFGTQWAVRSGDWKLLQAREGRGGTIQIAKEGPVRLFNLKEDKEEKNDLIRSYPEKAAELQSLWNTWEQQLPDPFWLPNTKD